MKKMLSVIFVMLSLSLSAKAQDIGIVAGLRSDNANADSTNETISSKIGYQAGLVGKFDFFGPLQLRSGFIYTSRTFGYSATGQSPATGEFNVTYFEIPAGLFFKLNDYGGAFIGAALNLNLAKSCPGGSCAGADVAQAPISFQLGASFKVAPQIGFEVYYESMGGSIAQDVRSVRSIVGNLLVSFE